jgi:lysophospholipase L1-like esterase
MARRARWVAAASAATAALAAMVFATGTAHAESNGGVRVMPLGDSITDGYNVAGGYRIDLWQKLAAGGYRIDFVGSQSNGPSSLGDHDHEGHSGWTIAQIDANIVSWLRSTTPRTILLHIGTNDMFNDAAGAPQRLSTLLDHIAATAPNADVFVAQIIPRSGADSPVRTFNAAIPAIVQSKVSAGKHLHLVDMFTPLTLSDLADGIHPNAGGYAKMATVWYNALRAVPDSITGGTTPTTAPPTSPPTTVSPSPTKAPPTSAPPTSAPPTTAPPTSAPPSQNGACVATYRVANSWTGGFQAEVSVANGGSTALNGWTVRMTLASGQAINNLWNGVNTGTTGSVTVKNAAYNGVIAGSGSTMFGFVATGNGSVVPSSISCASP